MKWTPWIRVVESTTVPRTMPSGGMFLRVEGNEKEPLGQHIIETPVDVEATEVLRDPRSPFIPYVPVGSIKQGEVRQLYDMRQGTRKGLWSDLMKPVVAKLSDADMIAIAAYTASRTP